MTGLHTIHLRDYRMPTAFESSTSPVRGFLAHFHLESIQQFVEPAEQINDAHELTIASSSGPSFRTAEVCTEIQYSHPITAETETAMISFVSWSSFPDPFMMALTLFQLASR